MGADSGQIAEIKSRLDIVEIVRRYVPLKPVSGRWMGACPFHQETKPSLSVNPDRGFYYCFGCQATGDVIDFYARINGLEFPEALKDLAVEAGVELTSSRPDPDADKKRKLRRACLEMHEASAAYFRKMLSAGGGKPARDYIKRRKLDKEMVQRFGLGYAPEEWQALLGHLGGQGFTPEQGVTAGLLSQNEAGRIYDRFRGRLIFPISDVAGRIIAFGGRILGDGDPKYLNSSDSPIYKKGEHLYGLHQARPAMARSRRALLTEGYMDVIALVQHGYEDSVGVLGTALTPDQVKRLAGFAGRIELVFDGDAAGRKAALRSAEMILASGLDCKVILLPLGKDVDDVLRESGSEGFDACLEDARDGLDFCMGELTSRGSARETIEWADGFLKKLKDPTWRAYFLPRLADGLGLSEAELARNRDFGRARERAGNGNPTPAPASGGSRRPGMGSPKGAGLARDCRLIEFFIRHPDYVGRVDQEELDAVLGTEWGRGFMEKLFIRSADGGEDVFARLDDEERKLYARALEEPERSGEEVEKQWDELCENIHRNARMCRMGNLARAIKEAEQRGDRDEADRLIAALAHVTAQTSGET